MNSNITSKANNQQINQSYSLVLQQLENIHRYIYTFRRLLQAQVRDPLLNFIHVGIDKLVKG